MWFRVTVLASLLLSILRPSSAAQIAPQLREAMQAPLEAVWKKDTARGPASPQTNSPSWFPKASS
jgi:hypothetical protein